MALPLKLSSIVRVPVVALVAGSLFAQSPFTLSEKDEIELGRHAAGEIE
jgi:hypothetical protein